MGKKKGAAKSERARLQVPIDKESAKRIEELAKRLGRTQANLVGLLLEDIVVERKTVADWVYRNLVRAVSKPMRAAKRAIKKDQKSESIRIQTVVSKHVAVEVEEIAEAMGSTPMKTAGFLVEQSLQDSGWIIQFVTTRSVDAARDFLGVPRKNSGAKSTREAPKGRKTR